MAKGRVKLLTLRDEPVARDMRRIAAALTIASDLERVGDHGKRIAGSCFGCIKASSRSRWVICR